MRISNILRETEKTVLIIIKHYYYEVKLFFYEISTN